MAPGGRQNAAMDPAAHRLPPALPTPRRRLLAGAVLIPALALGAGCASLAGDPPRVTLVGLESLPGQGLELRLLARLRVQNPGSAPIRYDGVSVELDLRGQPFASGVAPVAGTLAPFSEAVIELPVSVSGLNMLRQALDWVRELSRDGAAGTPPRLPYVLRGRLGGWGGPRFESRGVVDLPELGSARPAGAPPR
jgi:hypothetical protein